jgi:small basic protein
MLQKNESAKLSASSLLLSGSKRTIVRKQEFDELVFLVGFIVAILLVATGAMLVGTVPSRLSALAQVLLFIALFAGAMALRRLVRRIRDRLPD